MRSKAPSAGTRAAAVVAALFLPPLGVFLARGLGPGFWISVALTLLFFIPGVIFSLVAILRPDFLPVKVTAPA